MGVRDLNCARRVCDAHGSERPGVTHESRGHGADDAGEAPGLGSEGTGCPGAGPVQSGLASEFLWDSGGKQARKTKDPEPKLRAPVDQARAKVGVNYGLQNVVAPVAQAALTRTVMLPDVNELAPCCLTVRSVQPQLVTPTTML